VTGASLVVIEHDLPLVMSISDRIVALDLGRVVSDGDADHVVHDPNVVESYLGTNPPLPTPSNRRQQTTV